MRLLKLSVATAALLTLSGSALANSLSDAFKNGKVSGEVRAFYMNSDSDGGNDSKVFATGGKLAYESAPIKGFVAGAAFYTSHDMGTYSALEDSSSFSFLDSSDDSFSVLGQAYIQYSMGNTTLKVGRQQIDSPLAGSDDIRIVPNLFEGYLLLNSDIENITLVAAHLTKMMGPIDSSGNGEDFVSMSEAAGAGALIESGGVTAVAAIYSGLPNTTLQAWYYIAQDLLDAYYIDASYDGKAGEVGYALGAQYWSIDSDSKIDSANGSKFSDYDVVGLMGSLTYKEFGATLAYNSVDIEAGSSVHGAWGHYPEYAFAEEFWINSATFTKELDVTKAAISYDAGFATFSAAYVEFDSNNLNSDVDVLDISANMELAGVDATVVYEQQDYDATNSDNDLLKVRLSYPF